MIGAPRSAAAEDGTFAVASPVAGLTLRSAASAAADAHAHAHGHGHENGAHGHAHAHAHEHVHAASVAPSPPVVSAADVQPVLHA